MTMVTPKDAATVIMLRGMSPEDTGGFEVLMALRSSRSAFVPCSHVFPGGRVDDADRSAGMRRFVGPVDSLEIDRVLGGSKKGREALGIWIAAVRETFEEVGILLASPRGSSRVVTVDSPDERGRYRSCRRDLLSERATLEDILKREDLTLALNRLHYFSRWITPEQSPLRYDTRFFIAAVPPGQEACHDGEEVTGHRWITPGRALEEYRLGRFHMVVPTIVTLEELCRFQTVDEVIASTRGKVITDRLNRFVDEDGEITEHTPDGRVFRNLVPRR
ncbi:MAG: hypothetical protein AVO39_05655 [delta proteobacterium MLS_D]|jgi:8-oxo-dGTP pyrophosphatase MutT (NUDIX family)|nr:MAG: hypothetical protein AVO39_05655 [delta proteobacterium MLS_D]